MHRNLQVETNRNESSFALYEKLLRIKLKNRRFYIMELGYFYAAVRSR